MSSNGSSTEKVCDLTYLTEMMFGNKEMMSEIINDFQNQIIPDLKIFNDAVIREDFPAIKQSAHKMKSTVGIMGISTLSPILAEIETLSAERKDPERIKLLSTRVNAICEKAIIELKN